MTLSAKIMMCLNLWLPPEGMHIASGELLSYYYNQEMALARIQDDDTRHLGVDWLRKHKFKAKNKLYWSEFKQLFSLPNSDFIRIPVCIQSPSEEA